jgi:regulator of protease activity HflC (stomatin/prohibitin superfamily)
VAKQWPPEENPRAIMSQTSTPQPEPSGPSTATTSSPPAAPVGHNGVRVDVTERPAWTAGGLLALLVVVVLGIGAVALLGSGQTALQVLGFIAGLAALLLLSSLVVVSPGDTRVMQFFGRYVGTVRRTGLSMVVPLTTRQKVSVRVHNFETNRLKVNDADGNPVEIAAIVVWQVADTARAVFAVQDYRAFISVQSEAALRHVAGTRPYDNEMEPARSLRGNTDQVGAELAHEVAARIDIAGIEILEVRISHLAYAPEIAQVMLQRQQAAAVIAARSRIVDGAVGMVEMALTQLSERNVVELDEERKAAMVSNLLVILCGDSRATPIVNAGTLYQ